MARAGNITSPMREIAREEGKDLAVIVREVAAGRIVIPANRSRGDGRRTARGIGRGLRTKVSANVAGGSSGDWEAQQARVALDAGADILMETTTWPAAAAVNYRRLLLQTADAAIGTIPIYQAAAESQETYGTEVGMSAEHLLRVVEEQAKDGADLLVIHAAATLETLQLARTDRRAAGVVSYGGAILLGWMLYHQRPLIAFWTSPGHTM